MPRVASDFTAEDGLKWERYTEKCKLFHAGKANHPGAPPEGYISVYRAIKKKGPGGFRGGPGGFRGGRGGDQGDRGKKEKGAHHPKNFAERVSPPREPKVKYYDCRKDRCKQQREQRADNQITVSEAGPSDTYDIDVQEGFIAGLRESRSKIREAKVNSVSLDEKRY
ncbi:hypothetical protein BC835DRAFT_1419283 [Cytidiella melzeri]|nr:hypothetical protein BC835DRAFT_1419283 [Cytidiella melzeri]